MKKREIVFVMFIHVTLMWKTYLKNLGFVDTFNMFLDNVSAAIERMNVFSKVVCVSNKESDKALFFCLPFYN